MLISNPQKSFWKVPDWADLHHMANALAGGIYESSFGQDYYKIGEKNNVKKCSGGWFDPHFFFILYEKMGRKVSKLTFLNSL